MFDEDLLIGFVDEAKEHLTTIEPDLLAIESNPTNMDIVNRLFRSVHSIKGGAGFFGLEQLGTLSHAMENLMSKARTSEMILGKKHIDALLKGLDKLNHMIDDVANSNTSDIAEELKLFDSLEAVTKTETDSESVDIPDTELQIQNQNFTVDKSEIEAVSKSGMDIYSISLFLVKDIAVKNKTPIQLIAELEEFGKFIDGHLETSTITTLESCLDEDLCFEFIFATIMDASLIAAVLEIDPKNIVPFDIESYTAVKQEESILENKETESEPITNLPVSAAELSVLSTVKAEKTTTTPVAKKIQVEESIRVSLKKLNKLINMAGELVLIRNQLLQASNNEAEDIPGLPGIMQTLNSVTSSLQEEILNTRMQTVSTVFDRFPRLIRELSGKLGKNIQLVQEGSEVELDKTVLEAISDPLTHIVRNSADHGIEMPEIRLKHGKTEQGKLLLKAYHESGQVVIKVQDDGGGIIPDKIASIALEKGLVNQKTIEKYSDQEKINLIFLPGFSTAEIVSSVSGRGVGMDVVRSNIEGIGGTVEICSIPEQQTIIKMTLPLTMAIVPCIIVMSSGQSFAIPKVYLEELVMIEPERFYSSLSYIQNSEVLKLRGSLLPLISLAKGLDIKTNQDDMYHYLSRELKSIANFDPFNVDLNEQVSIPLDSEKYNESLRILIISVGTDKIGIVIDSIIGNEEIVVKPIPSYIKNLNTYSGTTILGDGSVAMIVDMLGFIQKNRIQLKHKRQDDQIESARIKNIEQEEQSILIFDNGTNEQFAVNIPLIQRVDTISQNQIQSVGKNEYLNYHDQQMRVIRLDDYLPIKKPDQYPENPNIIIPKDTNIPIGILINQILDTKSLKLKMSDGIVHANGIFGSILIDEKITVVLDICKIVETAEPKAFMHSLKTAIETNASILLIEDTPFFQIMINEYLTSEGFVVTKAKDGKEALEILENETFDIILSDIEMPVMNGFEFIQHFRAIEKNKKIPVIALTSLNDEKNIQKGKNMGFDGWQVKLGKPKIIQCVNEQLQKSRSI
ncbi:MAG: response regulator [Deltaproteobacteria bacterium]|jgi:two-component system, chemotaxis family, sensor kinase CheA|nr:response regulator [Deltaproteobacteria bacterium]